MKKTILLSLLILIASISYADAEADKQIQKAYEKVKNTIKAEKLSEEKQKAVWMTFLNMYGDKQYSGTLSALKKLASNIYFETGLEYTDPTTGMKFVFVKGGCYQMGSNNSESDEKPAHEVCVDDFYMGKYEVTQGQWQKIMGNNPSRFKQCGSDCPVEQVSWNDAQDFIRKLNSRSSVTFRLPTEAEWEYAAKGGDNHTYSGSNYVNGVAWYYGNSGSKTHKVGTKQANGFGLYDMSGNVYEWVEDIYSETAYSQHQRNNPIYTGSGSSRVFRGGSCYDLAQGVRSADRSGWKPGSRFRDLGFRLSRTVH